MRRKFALNSGFEARSEHRFPAPSSKLCLSELVTPVKGTLLSPRNCPPTLSEYILLFVHRSEMAYQGQGHWGAGGGGGAKE